MALTKEICVRYYSSQHGGSPYARRLQEGGSLPVFRAGRHDQEGAGLGSLLAGLFRRVLPLAIKHVVPAAARGLSSFASNMMEAQRQGMSLGEAAKAAILPAVGDAADSVMSTIQGSGKRRPATKRSAQPGGRAGGGPRAKRSKPNQAHRGGAGKAHTKPKASRQAGGRKGNKRTSQKGSGKNRVYKKRGGGAARSKKSSARFDEGNF
jgi:hypothetical protein